MQQAVFHSVSVRRDARGASSAVPFYAHQGSAAKWRIGILKNNGQLDDLVGVTSISLRVVSYGGAKPGSVAWFERTVASSDFLTPVSAQGVISGAEWNVEISASDEDMTLPVEDSGERSYWFEWRASDGSNKWILAAGIVIFKGSGQGGSKYATGEDVEAEAEARAAGDTAEAAARTAADTAEAAAREAADTAEAAARAAADATLTAGQTTQAGQISALGATVNTKADRDLVNAVTDSVITRLIKAGAVTLEKLDPALQSSIGSGLDYTKFVDEWNAATNTPTIPAAAGNTGKWYFVNVAGTPASGNVPLVAYAVADRIVSNGATWVKMKAAPTVILDGSIPDTALMDFIVRNDVQLSNGVTAIHVWATEDATEVIAAIDNQGRFWPDPAAGLGSRMTAVETKTANLGLGLLPQNWIEGTEIWVNGCWVMDAGEYVQLVSAELTEDGTEVLHGFSSNGTRYPRSEGTSNYNPPGYSVYPQDGGGVALADEDGERAIIVEPSVWKGIQPTSESGEWIGASGRMGGVRLYRFNINTGAVIPEKPDLLIHFGVTGQSLAAGGNGGPDILTTTAIYPSDNFMFTGGTGAGLNGTGLNSTTTAALVPMLQTVWSGRTYETLIPGFMNRLNRKLTSLMGRRVKLFCSNHAFGGKAYIDIKNGTAPFANGVYEVTKAKALANARGWEYLYGGTLLVHGEQDRVIGTTAAAYEGYIKELAADESAAYRAITGQAFDHRIYTCGMHSWTSYGFTTPTTTIGQLTAALSSLRVRMMGPKYILSYSDGIHLINYTYRLLGERYAEMVFCDLFGPGTWKPFAPVELGQTSDTVWARMQTPQGHAMALDTALVSDPGRYGFEIPGGFISGTPYLDGNRVVIPKTSGANATELRYAYTGTAGALAGPATGARGCLRDVYPQVSDYDSTPLHNYCNTFAFAVPPAP